MYDRIYVVISNQPLSKSPHVRPLTLKAIGELTGYNPDGETVASVLATLKSGKGVRLFTKSTGRDKGTDGIDYLFLPVAIGESDDSPPNVRTIVKF